MPARRAHYIKTLLTSAVAVVALGWGGVSASPLASLTPVEKPRSPDASFLAEIPLKDKPLRAAGLITFPEVLPKPKPLIPGVTLPPPAPDPLPGMTSRSVTIAKGDTLMRVLTRNGVARNRAAQAIAAISDVYDPRKLKIGQEVKILLAPEQTGARPEFVGLKIAADEVTEAGAQAQGEAFISFKSEIPLSMEMAAAGGEIEISLYGAARQASLPHDVMLNMVNLLSHEVDFQRDLQPGDRFQVMYEQFKTPDGKPVRNGRIVYAGMVLSGTDVQVYRYRDSFGTEDYYDRDGQSYRRALMRTPIDGARLSSGFGKRRHPVLGYTKMHRGVDFAAPIGTPIYAAGNGTIERANWYSSYGKYVRIRHTNEYSTAYAHLSRFAEGMYAGARVKQGEVIGYVGNTGRSTGPHLHYEILKNGRQVNPMRVKMPAGQRLNGPELDDFLRNAAQIDQEVAALLGQPSITEIAQNR